MTDDSKPDDTPVPRPSLDDFADGFTDIISIDLDAYRAADERARSVKSAPFPEKQPNPDATPPAVVTPVVNVPSVAPPVPPAVASADAPPSPQPPTAPPAATKPAPKKAAWLTLEPADRSDPTDHEVCQVGTRAPDWTVAAASVRGKLHAHKGMWRDDAFRWGTAGHWTILAVADGAGSAPLSRVGARLACDAAVTKLQTVLFPPGRGDGKQPPQADLELLRISMGRAGEEARRAVITEASRRGRPSKDFYSTLIVLAHTPWTDRDIVVVLQVGDGAAGLMAADGFRRIGVSDHGDYSSETRFLTTPGMELEFENRVVFSLPRAVKAIALMTDGVSDDFYPEDTRLVEVFDADPVPGITTPDGGPVRGLMHGVARSEAPHEALRDWLKYEKRASSDDRTALLMFRRQP